MHPCGSDKIHQALLKRLSLNEWATYAATRETEIWIQL